MNQVRMYCTSSMDQVCSGHVLDVYLIYTCAILNHKYSTSTLSVQYIWTYCKYARTYSKGYLTRTWTTLDPHLRNKTVLHFKCSTGVLVGSMPILHVKCSTKTLAGSTSILYLKCTSSVLDKSIAVLHLKLSMCVLMRSMTTLYLKLSMCVLDRECVYNSE